MTTQFKVGDRIRHFKGGEYIIISQIESGEFAEETEISLCYSGLSLLCKAATYIPLKTECFVYQNVATKQYWIRPCSEFGELITRPRFEVMRGES